MVGQPNILYTLKRKTAKTCVHPDSRLLISCSLEIAVECIRLTGGAIAVVLSIIYGQAEDEKQTGAAAPCPWWGQP